METVAPFTEVIEEIKEKGGSAVSRCFQCGKCDTVCPWNRVRPFSMRKLIREATFGLTEIEEEELWRCTTCGRCPQVCPRDVQQIDDMVALRRLATGYGVFPGGTKLVRTISAYLSAQGNPFNEDRAARGNWARELAVPSFAEGMELLYFPCCYTSYDPRLTKVAQATARVLQTAQVDFGILGAQESCCGESIRKTGNEELFRRLAKDNIKTFVEHGVQTILVSSPHCYQAFKNEYAEFKVHFDVVHTSQFVADLLQTGRLQITKPYAKTITYHDPCYLGRHNGVYDAPRAALQQIPGLALREMDENRAESLCCGMGGGRIWMETPMAERFSTIRLEEAVGRGAEEFVTACPYCITNFEDTAAALGYADALPVKDLTEVLQEVL